MKEYNYAKQAHSQEWHDRHKSIFLDRIITREKPGKLHVTDEELLESNLTQFGSACNVLPSSAPQKLIYRQRLFF